MSNLGGRPEKLSDCKYCGQPFGYRTMREHVRVCTKRVCTKTKRVCTTNGDEIVTGRKRKPAKAQIALGDPRKKGVHKLEQELAAEPKASRGLPPCPDYLKGRARDAWQFWAEELAAMDLDRRPDSHMLEGCCVAYDAAVDAYETIQKQGRLIAKKALDPKTNTMVVVDVRPHPAVRQGNQAWALMRAFCSEFGLSPVSRIRLSIEKEDGGEADLLELLGRPREKRTPPIVVQ
jgi:P27 family predicted phage terminase small subunit